MVLEVYRRKGFLVAVVGFRVSGAGTRILLRGCRGKKKKCLSRVWPADPFRVH